MGKLKKGVNEKAADAKASKESAKASKKEKDAKQQEDAEWAAAGEGTACCSPSQSSASDVGCPHDAHSAAHPIFTAGKLTSSQQHKQRKLAN